MPYPTRLIGSEVIAERTMAFSFERPAGFAYEAGQNATLTVIDMAGVDSYGASRTFSFVSAPHEPALVFASRIRDSALKRTLQAARPGLRASIDGPSGVMTLHEDASRPAVFLAGGIGVTPFVSILRHAAHARLPHRLWLFYSNRRPEDAPFVAELQALEHAGASFRFVPTMTKLQNSRQPWAGETGPISKALLARHLPAGLAPIYYLAGPPGLVMCLRDLLGVLRVAEEDIRDEEFYGY
ncbi:MAG TPA: FAD-dependent oxidoreductase [Burkholderiales bacterium]|jgi:ferredoxin-NADP reductase|nr:FAD-dependent oxidoreductase [Burkholderiales bacterium]